MTEQRTIELMGIPVVEDPTMKPGEWKMEQRSSNQPCEHLWIQQGAEHCAYCQKCRRCSDEIERLTAELAMRPSEYRDHYREKYDRLRALLKKLMPPYFDIDAALAGAAVEKGRYAETWNDRMGVTDETLAGVPVVTDDDLPPTGWYLRKDSK